MDIWINLRWLGKGLQTASAIVGGGIALWLIDGPEPWVKPIVTALLWMLAAGILFDMWYEIHLLQTRDRT